MFCYLQKTGLSTTMSTILSITPSLAVIDPALNWEDYKNVAIISGPASISSTVLTKSNKTKSTENQLKVDERVFDALYETVEKWLKSLPNYETITLVTGAAAWVDFLAIFLAFHYPEIRVIICLPPHVSFTPQKKFFCLNPKGTIQAAVLNKLHANFETQTGMNSIEYLSRLVRENDDPSRQRCRLIHAHLKGIQHTPILPVTSLMISKQIPIHKAFLFNDSESSVFSKNNPASQINAYWNQNKANICKKNIPQLLTVHKFHH